MIGIACRKYLLAVFLTLCILGLPGFIACFSGTKRCADSECEVVISTGYAAMNYSPGAKGMVSLRTGAQIEVFSKRVGEKGNFWEVKVGGRRGFVDKQFIRETKVNVRDDDLKFEVPVAPLTSLSNENDLRKKNLDEDEPTKPIHKLAEIIPEQTLTAESDKLESLPNLNQLGRNSKETSHYPDKDQHASSPLVDERPKSMGPEKTTATIGEPTHINIDNEVAELKKSTQADSSIVENPSQPSQNIESPKASSDSEEHSENSAEISEFGSKINTLQADSENSTINELTEKNPSENSGNTNSIEEHRNKENIAQPEVLTDSQSFVKTNETRSLESDNNVALNTSTDSSVLSSTIHKVNLTDNQRQHTDDVVEGNENINSKTNPSSEVAAEALLTGLESNVSSNSRSENSLKPSDKILTEVEAVEIQTVLNQTSQSTENVNEIDYEILKSNETNRTELPNPMITIPQTNSSSQAPAMASKKQESTIGAASHSSTEYDGRSADISETAHMSEDEDKSLLTENESDNAKNVKEVHDNDLLKEEIREPLADPDLLTETPDTLHDKPDPSTAPEIETQLSESLEETKFRIDSPNVTEGDKSDILSENASSISLDSPNVAEGDKSDILLESDSSISTPWTDSRTHLLPEASDETHTKSTPTGQGDELSSQTLEHDSESTGQTSTSPPNVVDAPKDDSLFSTIINTVNYFVATEEKDVLIRRNEEENEQHFAEPISDPTACHQSYEVWLSSLMCYYELFIHIAESLEDTSKLIASLCGIGVASLIFILGCYCYSGNGKEKFWLEKVNILERNLMAAFKENAVLKDELSSTSDKLTSIENNISGRSNALSSLNDQLDNERREKENLKVEISGLQKELEVATEAGLELNKIVSELLANQTNDESLLRSVDQLQSQLDEQQNVINEINGKLAERSIENAGLQQMLVEQDLRLSNEITSLKEIINELESQKTQLEIDVEGLRKRHEEQIDQILRDKKSVIDQLQHNNIELNSKLENEQLQLQRRKSKIEALESCLMKMKKNPDAKASELINLVEVQAELLDVQKQCSLLKTQLASEAEAKTMLQKQFESASAELEKLKSDYSESEKKKLEAQTRLEVLSNYFKEKEMELQKELSQKEEICLKGQGETADTVQKLTSLQEEIRTLRSQNDALCAEIEAQSSAHKSHMANIESRERESWIEARAANRRYEQAVAETAILRRKLTAMANASEHSTNVLDSQVDPNEPNCTSLSMRLDAPTPPMLSNLHHPHPPLPYMHPPPHFLPPPPFQQNEDMPSGSVGPYIFNPIPPHRMEHYRQAQNSDYDYSYDEDEFDDDESTYSASRRPYMHRRRPVYSPGPRTYRSLSPSENRYNHSGSDRSPPISPRSSCQTRMINEV